MESSLSTFSAQPQLCLTRLPSWLQKWGVRGQGWSDLGGASKPWSRRSNEGEQSTTATRSRDRTGADWFPATYRSPFLCFLLRDGQALKRRSRLEAKTLGAKLHPFEDACGSLGSVLTTQSLGRGRRPVLLKTYEQLHAFQSRNFPAISDQFPHKSTKLITLFQVMLLMPAYQDYSGLWRKTRLTGLGQAGRFERCASLRMGTVFWVEPWQLYGLE